MTDWDSFVEHTQESDAITGEPIPEGPRCRDCREVRPLGWAGCCRPCWDHRGEVGRAEWQALRAREEAVEARRTAVEAFLASQRRPVPESTPEAPQRSQEGVCVACAGTGQFFYDDVGWDRCAACEPEARSETQEGS